MEKNLLQCNLSTITDGVLFVEQPLTPQRRQYITPHINTYQHINTFLHAQKHTAQTRHTTKHIFAFSTDTAPLLFQEARGLHRNTQKCFLHDATMFAHQGMGHGPRTLALKASQGRVYRES